MELSENKLSFNEKLTLSVSKFKKILSKYHSLGQTPLSVLMIPHNQEKIFKFSTSYYFIYFLGILSAILLLSTILFSLYFLWIDQNFQQASSKGNKESIIFKQYSLLGEEISDLLDSLSSSNKELDSVIWGKSSKLSKFEIFQTLEKEDEIEQVSNMNLFQSTNQNYSDFIRELHKTKDNFQSSMDYLETRESIFASMPRGRPLGAGIGLITSTFGVREDPFYVGIGEFHNGIDFASANGTPIYATAPGIVIDASNSDGGLGNHVRIEHENGFHTTYGHCSELFVKKGDRVKRGDLIASVGASGKATGNHLHYEVRVGNDPPMNPQEFINID